jgi:threonine dehydratase
MGVQVAEHERVLFISMLDQIGFRYWDETENEAYRLFLREK